jgi:hypothetical protein
MENKKLKMIENASPKLFQKLDETLYLLIELSGMRLNSRVKYMVMKKKKEIEDLLIPIWDTEA